jgi:CRISPR-associated protein Cmr1
MKEVKLTLKVITPLFMGGANQQAELRSQSIKVEKKKKEKENVIQAELRSQSFNGVLRWWFRAAGGSFEDEKKLFGWGGENSNKGGVKLVISQKLNSQIFEKEFDEHDNVRQDRGINYLGFSLDQRFNKNQDKPRRKYITENQQFSMKIYFYPSLKQEDIKKFFATLWLAFNLGNFGSRSRRGFGSLRIEKIDSEGKNLIISDCFGLNFKLNSNDELNSNDVNSWINNNLNSWINNNLNRIKEIIHPNARKDIPFIFGDEFKIYKIDKAKYSNWQNWREKVQEYRKGKFLKTSWGGNGIYGWKDLLDFMGFLLMAYRSYKQPDYDVAKSILQNKNLQNMTFERAIFGLPLNFFYSSLINPKTGKSGYGDKVDLVEIINNKTYAYRRASPLMMKILQNDNSYEGLFIIAKSKFKPDNYELKFQRKDITLPKNNEWKAIDDFISSLKNNSLIEDIK